MKKTNLNQLAYTGTGELFLNYYALQLHGKNNVETWIAQANKLGIRVHIWQQVFYNNNTGWINPVKNGKINNNIIEEKITESLQYAKIKGISGIHFDYLRYNNNAYQTSKSTEAINTFTQKATQAIHNIDTRLIVSSTIIPEKENSQYYYAQDYNTLSKYLDVIIPLLYKGNYGKDTTWIQDNIKYYTENTQHAQIWAGLQGYQSDYNLKKLSTTEITQDTQKTINTQAKGAIIYRIGLTNTINFNNIITNTNNNTNTSDSANSTNNNTNINTTDTTTNNTNINTTDTTTNNTNINTTDTTTNNTNINTTDTINNNNTTDTGNSTALNQEISIDEIIKMAREVNNIIPQIGIPKTITYNTTITYTTQQYLYLITKTTKQLTQNTTNNKIKIININPPTTQNTTTNINKITLNQQEYLNIAEQIINYTQTNNKAPDNIKTPQANITYNDLIKIYTQILTNYNNNKLPEYTTLHTTPTDQIPITDILQKANELQNFFKNNKYFPTTITLTGNTITQAEFLYLTTQTIQQLNNNNDENITYIKNIQTPTTPYNGDNINNTINKTEYLKITNNVLNYIKNNNIAPKYANSIVGKIHYLELIDAFTRILKYYQENKKLPQTVKINYPHNIQ